MKTINLDLPAMYGDHHVMEVRRLLLEMPGVEDVYASSGFRIVEVKFDEKKAKEKDLKTKLEDAGYLGELLTAVEPGVAVNQNGGEKPFFRHTTLYEQTRKTVSFSQKVNVQGRGLWPCPGVGAIKTMEE
jgi:copper chaperone CopZ